MSATELVDLAGEPARLLVAGAAPRRVVACRGQLLGAARLFDEPPLLRRGLARSREPVAREDERSAVLDEPGERDIAVRDGLLDPIDGFLGDREPAGAPVALVLEVMEHPFELVHEHPGPPVRAGHGREEPLTKLSAAAVDRDRGPLPHRCARAQETQRRDPERRDELLVELPLVADGCAVDLEPRRVGSGPEAALDTDDPAVLLVEELEPDGRVAGDLGAVARAGAERKLAVLGTLDAEEPELNRVEQG